MKNKYEFILILSYNFFSNFYIQAFSMIETQILDTIIFLYVWWNKFVFKSYFKENIWFLFCFVLFFVSLFEVHNYLSKPKLTCTSCPTSINLQNFFFFIKKPVFKSILFSRCILIHDIYTNPENKFQNC